MRKSSNKQPEERRKKEERKKKDTHTHTHTHTHIHTHKIKKKFERNPSKWRRKKLGKQKYETQTSPWLERSIAPHCVPIAHSFVSALMTKVRPFSKRRRHRLKRRLKHHLPSPNPPTGALVRNLQFQLGGIGALLGCHQSTTIKAAAAAAAAATTTTTTMIITVY